MLLNKNSRILKLKKEDNLTEIEGQSRQMLKKANKLGMHNIYSYLLSSIKHKTIIHQTQDRVQHHQEGTHFQSVHQPSTKLLQPWETITFKLKPHQGLLSQTIL